MRIRWTVPAADDLENIKRYLSENFPHLAQSTVRRIYESARSLKTFPSRGRNGRRSGTRELVLTPLPYIVAYRIKNETVEILNVWHNAQDRH
ncbi:MAG: type II toxin-antitoxin system RelE/ParE family toxin [Acidobacteriota bacterium]